jgi:hypothetical protein
MSAQNQNSGTLPPDRTELFRFVTALFCRADPDSFVSLRAFYDHKEGFALYEDWQTVRVTGNDEDIVDAAEDLARLAAEDDEPIVFAPPICTFSNRDKADEESVANGLTMSVELDANPAEGKRRLEAALGPMTLVMESGGLWIVAATGQVIPKLHLHLRLAVPTRSGIEHDFLKEANKLAAILAGGDPTGVPLVHPLRWAGSVHRKAEPRLARIIEYNPEVEITLAEALDKLRAAVKELGPGPEKGNGLDHSPPTDLLDLCAALAVIPNDDSDIPEGASWKQWTDMGLRIWAATGGSEAGLILFIDWSRRSKKFDEAATRERWKHYTKYPPNRTNAGAIFNRAREIWPDFVRPSELAQRARLDASLNEFEGRQPPPTEGNDDPSDEDDGVARADDEDHRRQLPPRAPVPPGQPAVKWAGEDGAPIPPRQWVLGTTFCRGYLSGLTGAGGTGKTALRLLQLIALALGHNLTGEHVFKRTKVLIVCLEDDENELRRRIRAACIKLVGVAIGNETEDYPARATMCRPSNAGIRTTRSRISPRPRSPRSLTHCATDLGRASSTCPMSRPRTIGPARRSAAWPRKPRARPSAS